MVLNRITDMANLGTLWFGADIDLTHLQQKITQGNQGILNALKMDYDPASYDQMVSKLRSALDRETFEIKISANTQKIVNDIQNATRGGFGSGAAPGLDSLTQKILDQQKAVNELRASVNALRAEQEKMGGSPKAYLDELAKYEKAKAELQNLIATQKAYDKATRKSADAKREASKAASNLTKNSIKLNATLFDGVNISTRLNSALSGLFAVASAKDFLNNVIEIGGQLEKQRISMGAIVGDVSRANDLFENIKNLAVKSPFGVVELDQYSKQLAAYGIEQSDLFGMTKRLADISAGAGQDIGRLALALGHVKSATYLTGMTLRQFSMNNIPMLKMLADYYSEVEERAVSTAEVQKRISQRQVSYDDVIEQIKRMTDEGGQFFNMQEKISESLQSKFKNLKDSFDIMYGEIAESTIGDMLKSFAEGATDISRNWKDVGAVLGEAAVAFGVIRTAMLFVNWLTSNMNKNTIAAALSEGRLSGLMMKRLVVAGQITKEQLLQAVATKKVSAADAELAAAEFNITRAQLERVAASGRYMGMLEKSSLATSRFTVAQLRLIAALRTERLTLMEKSLKGIQLAFSVIRTSANAATAAVASFMKPLLGFAAFSAVVDIFVEKSRKAEEQEQRLADMAEKANEGYKNMAETREKFKVGGSADMSDDEITNAIPDMVEALKNYSETANDTFNNAFKINEEGKAVNSLQEQYEILAKAVEDTTNAYQEYNKIRPMVEQSIEAAAPDKSWLDTTMMHVVGRFMPKEDVAVYYDLKEALEFYADAVGEADKAEQIFMRNHLDVVNVLEQMGVADAAQMTNDQIWETLTMWQYTMPDKFKDFANRLNGDTKDAFDDVIKQWDRLGVASTVATDRMKKSGEDFYKSAKVFWGEDMTSWPTNWKEIVLMAMKDATKGIKGFESMSEEAKNDLLNIWLAPFKITVDTSEAQQQVNNLLVELQNLVGKSWTVTIGVKGISSIEDVDNATKAYSKALENVESTRKRLAKLREQGDTSSEAYKRTLKDLIDNQNARDAAAAAIQHYGGDLPEPKEKGGGGRKGGASKTDEQLKIWREQKKELEEFWREYETLLKRMSSEKAIEEIGKRGLFPTLFDDKGALVFDVREGLSAAIENLLNSTDGSTIERKQFQIELKKTKFNIDEKAIQEAADRALRNMNEYINQQSGKYNLFKSLFEATGNEGFAESAFADGRIWDDAAREFEKKLQEVSGETSIDYAMSDAAAKEHFKEVEGGYELWKKIVDITQKNYTDALGKAKDAMVATMSIEDKIAKKEKEIEDLRAKSDGIDHTAEIAQAEQEITKLREELLSISPEFKALFKETTDMSIRQIQALYERVKAFKEQIDQFKTKDVTNANGEVIGYEYTKENGEPGYINISNYQKLEKQLGKLQRKVPELSISFNRLWRWITGEDGDNDGKADLVFKDIAQDLAKVMDAVKGTTEALSEMFDALGNEDLADGFAFAGDMLGAGSDIAKGIASGNPLDIINGVAKGISSIAKFHDKKLDKAIQRSQLEVKKLQNAYKNLEWEISHQLTAITRQQSAEMLANLEQQEQQLESQLANERKKKKKDGGKIIDMEQEIEEAKKQIATFYEELGKERYGLDLDSWASDLASAIVDAFAAGEDAAEAFDKKVADIMKNVVSQIVKIQVVKPAMKNLQKFLFGDNGIATTNSEGGVEITPKEASELVGELMKLKNAVDSGKNVYDVVAQAMKSMGLDMNGESTSSSSTSSTIKGITEQTADLLASYINAIRADVSVMRAEEGIDLPAITVAVQQISVLTATQLQVQSQIANNTMRNAEAAEEIWNMLSMATKDKAFGLYVR